MPALCGGSKTVQRKLVLLYVKYSLLPARGMRRGTGRDCHSFQITNDGVTTQRRRSLWKDITP